MGLSRLTTAHIAGIGAAVALLIGVGFYFLGPYKTSQNLAELKTREDTAQSKLANRAKNQKDLALAKQEVAQVKAEFARYEQRLMPKPPIDLTNQSETALTKAMITLWKQPF